MRVLRPWGPFLPPRMTSPQHRHCCLFAPEKGEAAPREGAVFAPYSRDIFRRLGAGRDPQPAPDIHDSPRETCPISCRGSRLGRTPQPICANRRPGWGHRDLAVVPVAKPCRETLLGMASPRLWGCLTVGTATCPAQHPQHQAPGR